jgi:ubiquitin carboxyl-terminal hydrolase 7
MHASLVSSLTLCFFTRRSVLLFPQGNSNGHANEMVSVYLNYGDTKHSPENWHVCAQFALAISNPEDPTHFIQSRAFNESSPFISLFDC